MCVCAVDAFDDMSLYMYMLTHMSWHVISQSIIYSLEGDTDTQLLLIHRSLSIDMHCFTGMFDGM